MSNDIKIHNKYLKLNQARAQKAAKGDNTKYIPDDYKKIAQGMESQFAQMMIKQMEQTSGVGEKSQSTSDSTYRSWMTTERAKVMSNSANKLGLQDIILDDIYPQKFRNQASYDQYQHMQDAKFNRIKRNRDAIKTANPEASVNGYQIQMNKLNEIVKAQENENE